MITILNRRARTASVALAIARLRSYGRPFLQPEEDRSGPARSSDQGGNLAQRGIALSLILEPVLEHDHGVSAAVPFAHQPGPRLQNGRGSKLRCPLAIAEYR